MITGIRSGELSAADHSQLERKDLARGAWAEGRPEDALLILDTVLAEEMVPAVAAECYVTRSAFLAEMGKFEESLECLDKAAPLIDLAGPKVKRAFYHQRGRAKRELGDFASALIDYTGAVICAESINDQENRGAALLNLAHIYLLKSDLEAARANLDKAFDCFRATNSFYLSQAYDTLACIELAAGYAERAMVAITQALELVGDNVAWREMLTTTRDRVRERLVELLGLSRVEDLDSIRAIIVKRALVQTNGNLSHAGKLVGLTYKGVDYIVQQHPELERFRPARKPRLKSLIKKSD